jgi:queuine/archaeosine tRNA-ribosyltransferase
MPVFYVPAGCEQYTRSSATLYISNKPNEKETTEFGLKIKRWKTHEKTVLSLVNSSRGTNWVDLDYDISIPMFNATFLQSLGISLILANPEVGIYNKDPFHNLGIQSIVDSGGFQMLRQGTDFVNPDEVIERYNKNADIGMPLDLPTIASVEDAYFDCISHLIRANDEYISKRLNKGIDLALISHGSSVARRKARLDVLDRKASVVAIAGLGTAQLPGVDKDLSAVENLMYVVSRYHKTTKYFHVLGITSKLYLFLYGILDASGYVQNIGGDSVSHRLDSLTGNYLTFDFQTLALAKNPTYKLSPSCSCPVCFGIDDMRVIQEPRILETHNLWVRVKQTEFLRNLAHEYLNGRMDLKEIHKLTDMSVDYAKFRRLVHYVQEVMAGGFKPIRKVAKTTSLLGGTAKVALQQDPHYEKCVVNYEKFHGKKFPRKV